MMNRTTLAIAAALLAVATTGCSRSNDEPVAAENYGEATDQPTEQPPEVVSEAPAPAPAPEPATNMMAEAPPEAAPAPDEQMMDDASATGMTARASRDAPATEETGPLEQVEKK